MKLSFYSLSLLTALLSLAFHQSAAAQVSAQMQESTVRILCPEPDEKGGPGLDIYQIKMPNGSVFESVGSSFGTGFVINKEGYIVSNNHVVAPDEKVEVPEKLVLVVQKVGKHYLMHKAKVVWQSANRDLAIIQCPQLKATPLPLLFDETKSTPSEEVFSIGFPGITDVAVEDFERSAEIRKQIIVAKAERTIAELQQKLRRRLSQNEIDAVVQNISEHTGAVSAERNALLAGLDVLLRQSDAAATTWDITNVVERKSLWKNYFTPTVTKGNIEQISRRHGMLGVSYPDVLTIQHSCAIKHGNSGGPLLNAGGQVIGVVGDGMSKTSSGDRESIEWAAASSELKGWLDDNHVGYILAQEWRKTPSLPVKIIVAIALAVAVALVALILGLLKFNQKPSFTTILRDPRMAKVLGTTHSKLIDVADSESQKTAGAPLPGFGKWQLAGRTPKGDSVHIEITDVMFSSNNNRLILGRTAELCHVVVNDNSVSKQHASLRKDGDRFLVADRNSSNHTAVNGQFNNKAFDEVPLKEGDTLTLGEVRLDFSKI
ncbi:MAG: trypsin-like peptidase domain-containing protein [Chthoniobacter sp.]|uniref:trypsin-like peptidase domain-containing protein n=1 Tax=Chthoniobacter sp. TaxID=2510640 RepID=UPI0032A1AD8F